MSRPEYDRISDILRALERVGSYVVHLRSDDVELSEMAFEAVLRNFAVIGEAVKSLPETVKSSHPEIPWASIVGLRNVVVHEYFDIKPELILDIVDNQLDSLAVALREEVGK